MVESVEKDSLFTRPNMCGVIPQGSLSRREACPKGKPPARDNHRNESIELQKKPLLKKLVRTDPFGKGVSI